MDFEIRYDIGELLLDKNRLMVDGMMSFVWNLDW